MTDKVVFGYWGTRGAGQVLRTLLAYTGATWEDHKYTDRDQWFSKDKASLGFDFPNLPYLIEGDFKLTESSAIGRYIVNRSGKTELLGKNPHDQAVVDMLLGVLADVRGVLLPLIFNPDWEKAKAAAGDSIRPKLARLNAFAGDKKFINGYLTVADFIISEISFYIEKIFPEDFKANAFLHTIRTNFEALPQIKAYYQSPTAVKGPFFPPTAAIQI